VPDMRPCHRNKLIIDRTDAHGHKNDRPSPRALDRFFEIEAEVAIQSAELAELAE
jgi:hypothetical protein